MVEIVLSGPGKNALSSDLMSSALAQVEAADNKPILFRGEGGAFSAGLNLMEVASLEGDAMTAFLALLERFMVAVFRHPAPTVACVNGHAIAGGSVLALSCDYSVATNSPKARIGLTEVALGLCFPPCCLEIITHRLPNWTQGEVLLGGALYAPTDALRVGLIDAVADDPLEAARERLSAWSKHPAAGYAQTKRALRPDVHFDDERHRTFCKDALPVWTSPKLRETIMAMLGK